MAFCWTATTLQAIVVHNNILLVGMQGVVHKFPDTQPGVQKVADVLRVVQEVANACCPVQKVSDTQLTVQTASMYIMSSSRKP